MTTILGIDPGSRSTGYAFIWVDGSKQGCITHGNISSKEENLCLRLDFIFQKLCQLITLHKPNEAAIEKVFIHQNAQSALKLGQARGAAIVAIAKYNIPIAEYSAKQIKQAAVGYGAAAKSQVQQMMQRIFQLETIPQNDAADALAVALCHGNTRAYHQKIQQAKEKL